MAIKNAIGPRRLTFAGATEYGAGTTVFVTETIQTWKKILGESAA
jgi:hypothetical protein